ncbi:MFS transporter [Sphingomonas sp. GC_Shp_3]|uniref:AmpG family muropeptide MFS transporter n=1 Tax=Sphingomonas sp. GC_Shp_3 TaxID=2937383 RepID=UPI00226997C3|nr:MFS transporter [Sphingomonas sp. GC_Shp_3]
MRLFVAALRTRKSASMLALGFSSGLPFALLIGTLNAWLGEVGIALATIGVLSWIGLATAFKFLWSPLVDRVRLPLLGRLGRRKGWIVLCQALIVVALIGLVVTDPTLDIGRFAAFAFLGAVSFATQDIAIDGWRIDVADDDTPVELLSAINQLGYRVASIVGGAVALYMASRMSWPTVYAVMAGVMAVLILFALAAPDTQRPPDIAVSALAAPGEVRPGLRAVALAIVGASWTWAIVTLVRFMVSMLAETPPGAPRPSPGDFLKYHGPAIVVATVLVPLAVAGWINWLKARGRGVQTVADTGTSAMRTAGNHLYGALIAPLADLAQRLGWGVLIVIGLILTYALCYNVWASFAYPFYLDYLHYTKDEVAFASKLFGIIMSILGVSLGGYLFVRIGRFPTVLVGAILPIFGNFLYADLADGAPYIDLVLGTLRLDHLAIALGSDERMARLLLTICYENISTGLALAAFVAYLSSIVSKQFAAVQYAVLSSLTFLIGSLGRGVAGEMFDTLGYATVFRYVAAVGLLAIVFVLLEWWRASRVSATAELGGTGEAA